MPEACPPDAARYGLLMPWMVSLGLWLLIALGIRELL
jgi:hypothetical protein